MIPIEEKSESVLKCLDAAVAEALDKKRRLGQYAVVRENGKIMYMDWSRNPDGELLSEPPK